MFNIINGIICTLKAFPEIIKETFVSTANIMLIIVSACGFSMYLSWERIPQMLAEWMMNVSDSKYMFFFLSMLIVFIFGMFIDGTALLLILTSILYPIAQGYGIDLLQFGLVFLVLYCFHAGCMFDHGVVPCNSYIPAKSDLWCVTVYNC